jgi:hypothetical protein
MPSDLDRMLNELGVIARPVPAPKPQRPVGATADWKGVWYPDGVIPH